MREFRLLARLEWPAAPKFAIVLGTEPAIAPWVSILYLTALVAIGAYLALKPLREELKP